MSDSTFEWRDLSLSTDKRYLIDKTHIPTRKTNPSDFDDARVDYSEIVLAKTARGLITSNRLTEAEYTLNGSSAIRNNGWTVYPRYLLAMFLFGCIGASAGMALLLLALFFKVGFMQIVGSSLLALGSVTVVLSLLRGQDLDERSK